MVRFVERDYYLVFILLYLGTLCALRVAYVLIVAWLCSSAVQLACTCTCTIFFFFFAFSSFFVDFSSIRISKIFSLVATGLLRVGRLVKTVLDSELI